MAENIYDVLRSEQPQLIPILDKNLDVCSFLKASYDHLLELTMSLGKKAEDLDLSIDIAMERLLKISISWKSQHEGVSALLRSRELYQRNLSLTSFMKANPKFRNLARDVVYILERWLKTEEYRKGLSYEQIKLENPIAWRDGRTITAEIVLKVDYDQMTTERLAKSSKKAEQPTESNVILTDDMVGPVN